MLCLLLGIVRAINFVAECHTLRLTSVLFISMLQTLRPFMDVFDGNSAVGMNIVQLLGMAVSIGAMAGYTYLRPPPSAEQRTVLVNEQFTKTIIRPGDGHTFPQPNDMCYMRYCLRLKDGRF